MFREFTFKRPNSGKQKSPSLAPRPCGIDFEKEQVRTTQLTHRRAVPILHYLAAWISLLLLKSLQQYIVGDRSVRIPDRDCRRYRDGVCARKDERSVLHPAISRARWDENVPVKGKDATSSPDNPFRLKSFGRVMPEEEHIDVWL